LLIARSLPSRKPEAAQAERHEQRAVRDHAQKERQLRPLEQRIHAHRVLEELARPRIEPLPPCEHGFLAGLVLEHVGPRAVRAS